MLRQILSEQEIHKVVRSDNGPHYSVQAFQDFVRELSFQHVTSSSNYPQSNGSIESQVNSVTVVILKTKPTHKNPEMALLCLKTPPVDCKLPSPDELLLGRAIQDNLTGKIPRVALNEEVAPRLEERQELQTVYHDRSARQLPELTPGQRVSIQDKSTLKFKLAEVREKLVTVPDLML